MEKINILEQDTIVPEHPELVPALGTALDTTEIPYIKDLAAFVAILTDRSIEAGVIEKREPPLFNNSDERQHWLANRFTPVKRTDINHIDGKACFIGIDSGSTTSKLVLIDEEGKLVLDYYISNKGNHTAAVREGLLIFKQALDEAGVSPIIKNSAVTGYGEDLIKTVFQIDIGVVETIAHFRAARMFNKEVSFILDIGGQDMKAMFIENGGIKNIEINEACSSGCGSFIQTFAANLNYSLTDFTTEACEAEAPCNLGSRCTVFMNSKVKQFLREGATVGEISAGLAYSVVRNCLNKVLKITDLNELGQNIVVQGGTFQNPSIHRAFEKMTERNIVCPDVSGHMGAYGAALIALDQYQSAPEESTFIGFNNLTTVTNATKKSLTCKACENFCSITRITFENGSTFFTGNKCEKVYSNSGSATRKGLSLTDFKTNLLFNRPMKPASKPLARIGIPRVLNMYANFPFWNTLHVECGLEVVLSDQSTMELYETGSGTVMSDNICFPAKLVHGHILNLKDKKVDRIFYPTVVYEKKEKGAKNSFNCPIVSGYPDVIRSAINTEGKYGIPLDKPTINFEDKKLLKRGCWEYMQQFGISQKTFIKAFDAAITAKQDFKSTLKSRAGEIVNIAEKEGRKVIMLIGRPYHLDPLINHKIPEIITSLGMDVITGDSTPGDSELKDIQVLTQWTYANRLYNAAKFAAEHPSIEIVHLNSFGCGPDIIAIDETRQLLKQAGKNITVLRIDDIASPGSIKLRLRTLTETLRLSGHPQKLALPRQFLPIFDIKDRSRQILFPHISHFLSPFVAEGFKSIGYNAVALPAPDDESLSYGLKYTNNEICYPAILVVGDIIKALNSGKYNLEEVAIGMTQTGGQCRASNYLSLIKKAMINAGFGHIPIVSLNASSAVENNQPGFKPKTTKLVKLWFSSIVMADILTQMYYSIAAREEVKGHALRVANKYIERGKEIVAVGKDNKKKIIALMKDATEEFNRIPLARDKVPQVGLVGEIYIKYSEFGNQNVIQWLTNRGVEVIFPPMIDFFTQEFLNIRFNTKANITNKDFYWYLSFIFESSANKFVTDINNATRDFKYYRAFHNLKDLSKKASEVVDLVNQYGEGWLLTSEIIGYAEEGIDNILCIQPFGCIANQITAKGVETRLKELHPSLNVLFIDLDHDTSSANYINRLHFLLKSAQETMEYQLQDA